MKYDLKIIYAGKEIIFKDLEHDDEYIADEGRRYGIDYNNDIIFQNFIDNIQVEIIRK